MFSHSKNPTQTADATARIRLLILCLLFAGSAAGQTHAEVGVPAGDVPFHIEYRNVYRRAMIQGDVSITPAVGPFYLDDFAAALPEGFETGGAHLISNPGANSIRLFSIVTESFHAERRSQGTDLFRFSGGMRYQPTDRFGATVIFDLDRAKAVDPDYTGIKWRGLAGDLQTAALYYRNGGLSLTLGRQRVFWGPQPVNLLLSSTAEPLDQFSVAYTRGRLSFNFLFGRLDGSRPDATDSLRFPDDSFEDNRYLVAHRLDVRLHRRLRLGLFETSLYGGEGRAPELTYLNPLQFFHSVQLNEQLDDNTIVGLDFTFLPGRKIGLYGQLMVDDFQIDDRTAGDKEPDELGILAGVMRTGKVGSLEPDLKLEYTRITNRTYHQRRPRNRYLYRNELLGHPLGPDADSISLSLSFWPGRAQVIDLELARCRHGEGSIYAPWDEPWMDVTGDYSEPFPTGVVQKSVGLAFRFEGYLPFSRLTSRHLFATIEVGYADYENFQNVVGAERSTAWFNVSLSWMGGIAIDTGD